MEEIPAIEIPSKSSTPQIVRFPLQICDFENIVWENVLKGQCGASSFLVRKGLSRKAQLSLQLRRFVSKHPTSPLKSAVPTTLILETWNAFEEMKLDFGGGTFASFEGDSMIMSAPLRQRLDWCLSDAKATVEEDPCTRGWCWILKSSVTNKGADIAIISEWEHVLDAMEEAPHIREWVLQRYIDKPLLVSVDRQQQRRRKQKLLQLQQNSLPLPRRVGHKFHLRVYVLCVGALRVFVFDQILLLIAAHSYCKEDRLDIHAHLSNTARAAEDVNFEEQKFVKLLDDLPHYLHSDYSELFPTLTSARVATARIKAEVHRIIADVFAAFENEYSVFCPMAHCFEVFGLDFMVDESMHVHFLEVNPGPDFKQTGDRLRGVIEQLWEQVLRIAVDSDILQPAAIAAAAAAAPSSSTAEQNGSTNTSICDVNRLKQPGQLLATHEALDAACEQEWRERAPDFTLVYSKEWSAAKHSGGMAFTSE